MQLIYNVTVSVDVNRSEEWLEWMRKTHIPDVMKTGAFLEARISKVTGHEEEGGKTYAVQYLCENRRTLEHYQKELSPQLQNDHTDKFGTCTAAFRTILEVQESF